MFYIFRKIKIISCKCTSYIIIGLITAFCKLFEFWNNKVVTSFSVSKWSHSVVDFLTTIKTNYYIRHFLIQILHNLVVKKYTISGKGKSEFLVVWLF